MLFLFLAAILKTPGHMMQELILASTSHCHHSKAEVPPNITGNSRLHVRSQEGLGWGQPWCGLSLGGAGCHQRDVVETPGLLLREGGSSAQEFLCVTGETGEKIKNLASA